MKKPLIHLENIYVSYPQQEVLTNVSLTVCDGDFIGVIGPNGGGKTTLLKVMLGLIKPQKGRVIYNIDRADIGYLPQGNRVDDKFPITVREVVASGLENRLRSGIRLSGRDRERLQSVLKEVGIEPLSDRAIGELSGGQLQRTLLARAIVSSPRVLLLDEPDTYVDNKFENELYTLLQRLNASMTILLVSHDIGMISPYIRSIACVNGDLHYHPSNEISEEQLKVYNCPIEIITHGTVPHRVIKSHSG